MRRGKAIAMRNGCQLKSFPVSLVRALICILHMHPLDERCPRVKPLRSTILCQALDASWSTCPLSCMQRVLTGHAISALTRVGLTATPPKYCHTQAATRMTVSSWIILRLSGTSALHRSMPRWPSSKARLMSPMMQGSTVWIDDRLKLDLSDTGSADLSSLKLAPRGVTFPTL